MLLGDSGVGKSSIATRFCKDTFDETHDVTIGGAYMQKVLTIPPQTPQGSEQQVKLHIWDTGGHEKFRAMVRMYYRDAVGAIICYDITTENSYSSVQHWIDELMQNTQVEEGKFVLALAGNKCDMPAKDRRIKAEVSQEIAKKHNMIFGEVSAKTGEGLPDLFRALAENVARLA